MPLKVELITASASAASTTSSTARPSSTIDWLIAARTINGTPTPFPEVHLYRGPSRDGHCQGVPFATVTLGADGSAVSNIVGWKQAPAFICVETQRKTVFDRFVRTLG